MNKKKALRVPDYLGHMLDAIHRIQRYVQGMSGSAFKDDQLVQDAVIRNIEIIGEAASNIANVAPGFTQQHSAVPWTALYAMRNRVSHGYWIVDLDVVWQVIQKDLPELETEISQLLKADDGLTAGVDA
jgi:uncharacterized protein with HEPN domain